MKDLLNVKMLNVLEIRGRRVVLDRNVASFYGVLVKDLIQNMKRSPKWSEKIDNNDYVFQLTKDEMADHNLLSANNKLSYVYSLPGIILFSAIFQKGKAIEMTQSVVEHFNKIEKGNVGIVDKKMFSLLTKNIEALTSGFNFMAQKINFVESEIVNLGDKVRGIEKVEKSNEIDNKDKKKRRIRVVFSFIDKVRSEAVKLKIHPVMLVENIIRDDIEKNSYIEPMSTSFRISDYPAKTKIEVFLTDYEYKMIKTLAWLDSKKIGHYVDQVVIDQIDQKIVKLIKL